MSFDVLNVVSQEATADVYGLGSEALMLNHIGDLAWDLIVTR